MGDQQISPLSGQTKTAFLRHLLDDIGALEQMIEEGLIEKGITRIGAEQELCLIKDDLRPAMTGPQILRTINEPHYTSELAQWNLEINLDPQEAKPGCLRKMDLQLNELLQLGKKQAAAVDCHVLLTGILPTIRKSELDFKYMTPNPRFRAMDKILRELRGEDFSLYIEGVDEINLKHGSILFEACNTSFQIHLQIDPAEFADKYNWAQVLAGPVLAACVNSPMLLGKELWQADMAHTLLYTLGINAGPGDRIVPERFNWDPDVLDESLRRLTNALRPWTIDFHVAQNDGTVHGTGSHDKTGRHCQVNDPNGKLNIDYHAGFWLREENGKLTKAVQHICWDGCMFPNEVMMRQETWNDILKAMITVRDPKRSACSFPAPPPSPRLTVNAGRFPTRPAAALSAWCTRI